MINDNFIIEQEELSFAQDVCSLIKDNHARNRAVANVAAAEIASKCINGHVVNASGLHNVIQVLNTLDIADIYVDNNYIDTRIYFDDNELCVPKMHYDLDILPLAYMFIKADKALSSGVVTGFMFPEDIDTEKDIDGYFPVEEESLKSFYDVEARLLPINDEEEESPEFIKNIYDFLDNKNVDLKEFYKKLISSASARNYLNAASKASFIYCSINSDTPTESSEENDTISDSLNEFSSEEIQTLDEPEDLGISELLPAENDIVDLMEAEPLTDSLETEDIESDFSDNYLESVNEEIEGLEALDAPMADSLMESDSIESLSANEDVLDLDEEAPELHNYANDNSTNFDNISDINPDNLYQETAESDIMSIQSTESEETISYENTENNDIALLDGNEVISEYNENENDSQELSEFDYSTDITPSIETIEIESDTEDAFGIEENTSDSEYETESNSNNEFENFEQSEDLPIEDDSSIVSEISEEDSATEDFSTMEEMPEDASEQKLSANEEQIETLFNKESPSSKLPPQKKSALPILGIIVLFGALGYFGYTKFFAQSPDIKKPADVSSIDIKNTKPENKTTQTKDIAMPIETVENTTVNKADNEMSNAEVSTIEKTLNASIEVSNLVINWEVPLSYANNTTAKRYFVKIGKILQLNLKTELLMMSNSPINNRIAMELTYNKNNGRFDIVKIVDSSGADNIDNTVRDTVNKILGMNMNMNMSIFETLQGNPILVIKL